MSDVINSRTNPYRIGKTKKKSYLMRGIARFLKENGPKTARECHEQATFKNGKPVKKHGNINTVANVMSRRKDFFIFEHNRHGHKWMIREDSELLD